MAIDKILKELWSTERNCQKMRKQFNYTTTLKTRSIIMWNNKIFELKKYVEEILEETQATFRPGRL